jgi:hypothetical protein
VNRLLSVLFALAAGPLAAAEIVAGDPPPGPAALEHLRELRAFEPEWRPDPAALGQPTREKIEAINAQLEDLRGRLRGGEFQVVKEKSADRLAAVLVAQVTEFRPDETQVHAVALIRRDGRWAPAPLPASFENTGIRYIPGLAETARELEIWMLAEIPRELARLRTRERERLDSEILKAVTRDELFEGPPGKIVADFLDACRRRDLPAALARLGGLEDPRPPDWREMLSAVATAFNRSGGFAGEWSALLSPSVMHTVMHADVGADEATVSLGEFDPAAAEGRSDPWRLRQFTLTRNDSGFWRLQLPDWLFDVRDREPERAIDRDLRAAVPEAILNARVPDGFDTVEALADSFFAALDQDDPATFFSHLRVPEDTAPETAAEILLGFSEIFRPVRTRSGRTFLLDHHQSGDRAVVLHGRFHTTRPQIPPDEIDLLRLEKLSGGWVIVPDLEPDPAADFDPPLSRWIREAAGRGAAEWLEILGLTSRPEGLPDRPAPDAGAAETSVMRWLEALDTGDPRRLFAVMSAFPGRASLDRAYSYLGQELPVDCRFELLEIHTRGRWAAASVRHSPPNGLPPTYLLHPLAATADGAKIFPEAILYHPDSRARSLLNESVFRHLEKQVSEEAVAELRELLDAHTRLVENLPENDAPPAD